GLSSPSRPRAVQRVRHIPDLDHFRHVMSMRACCPHVKVHGPVRSGALVPRKRIIRSMRHAVRVLVAALLVTALVKGAVRAQNPTPTTIPNGLPEWAYNLTDKVQPPE